MAGRRRRPALVAVEIDAAVWTAEVHRYRSGSVARAIAQRARRGIDRERGVDRNLLLACEAHGPDGTRLDRCVKLYLPAGRPPSEAPFGLVFEGVTSVVGTRLRLLAFGERHPTRGRSVYERAHLRLHGGSPGRGAGNVSGQVVAVSFLAQPQPCRSELSPNIRATHRAHGRRLAPTPKPRASRRLRPQVPRVGLSCTACARFTREPATSSRLATRVSATTLLPVHP